MKLLATALFFCSGTVLLRAQVSPGPLSTAHHALDTPLKCGSCHVFGAGKPKLRCLNCHLEIRQLAETKHGYHGRVVNRAKGDTDCARCHTEHYGQGLRIIRWPISKDEFDHRETGFPLVGRHSGLACEKCHNARGIAPESRKKIQVKDLSKTFEGLVTTCTGCHEDRHAGQLGVDCQKCHNETRWKPVVTFDHAATRYPLAGRHATVACEKCHRPLPANPKVIQYTKLNFAECTGCHQDPHHGAFAARCESCHNLNGWKEVRMTTSAFDHSRTKFPLNGKHEGLQCQKCHKDSNFKTAIAHEKCMDCHRDPHKAQFAHRADGGECGVCHTDKGWRPATFTVADHKATAYPLTGKHLAVACAKCHVPAGLDTNYHPRFQACLDCHKDPHGGQFAQPPLANGCEKCHTVDGFRPSTYTLTRHQSSPFALNGAHAGVACQDCHHEAPAGAGRDRQFRFASFHCEECHRDPHGGEFPATLKASLGAQGEICEHCHTLRSWRDLKPFDHATAGFALIGAHRTLVCGDCHRPQIQAPPLRRVAFLGASEKCAGCHEDIHAGQFQRGALAADCATCHNSTRWAATVFDHNRTSFSLSGAHERTPCRLCHNQRREINGRMVVVYRGTPRDCVACHKK